MKWYKNLAKNETLGHYKQLVRMKHWSISRKRHNDYKRKNTLRYTRTINKRQVDTQFIKLGVIYLSHT